MKVNTIPRCAFCTFTETELLFREKNKMFPEELSIVLQKLDYEIGYISTIIQREMDAAFAEYRKQLEAAIDKDNPFIVDPADGEPLLLDNSNILESLNSHGTGL